MATLRLELALGSPEQITFFNSDNEYFINELTYEQKEVFNDFLKLTDIGFITINNIPNDDLVIYYHSIFNHDENYSIDQFYVRKNLDYNDFSPFDKIIINNFILLINSLK